MDQGHDLAKSFYHSAKHSFSTGRSDLSILQLHQAVEYTCSTLIQMYLGYKPISYSLRRLLTLIENFTPLTMDVFPCVTKEEIELLNLLEKSHSHVWYSKRHSVSNEHVSILLDRVSRLQATAEFLYEEKIASLKPDRRNI